MEFTHLPIEQLWLLFSVAILAGFVDVLAGGGGLITVPALMMSGMTPLSVLATNKLQGSMGTATSSFMMFKSKRVRWYEVRGLMLAAFIGSVAGTVLVQFIDAESLSFIIPLILIVIAAYFLFSTCPAARQGSPVMSQVTYKNSVVPLIGCYDGMLGPGTGSFFAFSGVSLRGLEIIQSTTVAKTLNFATNIASLAVFLIAGHVVWTIGFVMMAGQVIGAWLGAHCLFKINPAHLRILIVIICLMMLFEYVSTSM